MKKYYMDIKSEYERGWVYVHEPNQKDTNNEIYVYNELNLSSCSFPKSDLVEITENEYNSVINSDSDSYEDIVNGLLKKYVK